MGICVSQFGVLTLTEKNDITQRFHSEVQSGGYYYPPLLSDSVIVSSNSIIINMTKVMKKRVRQYTRRKSRVGLPLYPSLYDSCVFYFNDTHNYAVQNGVAPTWTTKFFNTSMILNASQFTNLHSYFNKYRVEVMTLEVMICDPATGYNWTGLELASIHSGLTFTNISVDTNLMDSQRDLRNYAPGGANHFRHKWKMDPDLISDTQFQDIPLGVTNAPANYNGGVLFYVKSTNTLSTVTLPIACTVNVKWKVRVTGRSSVVAQLANNNLPI